MPAPLRFRIVTPVYRDVESFLILRDRIMALLGLDQPDPERLRFFVVDDTGGQDPDIAKVRPFADVCVVSPPFNLGHQRAIVLALRAISPLLAPDDIVITMDSDGEDRPEDLPRLVEALSSDDDPWRVVIARRTEREEPLTFRLLYLSFRILFRVLTGRSVRSGNYAAYRGAYVHSMLFHPSFDLCYSSSLITLNADPVFVPCPRGTRYAGQSRMGLEKLLTHGVRMLMPFADRIAIRSLAVCMTAVGLTVLSLAVVLVGHLTGAFSVSSSWSWLLLAGVVVAGLGLVNFLVLFAGYVQTDALSMARIDQHVSID
jgi:hypothetical protein